jgi:methyl-accepting chemotaxis protein
MNNQQLDDLKLFIDTRLSQTEITLRDEMGEMKRELEGKIGKIGNEVGSLKGEIRQLSQKMDDGFAGIADIFEQVNGRVDDHEHRIEKLEQQAA